MWTTNAIVNGNFQSSGAGWSGTDLEFNPLSVYQGSGASSSNIVAEVNGSASQTTVLFQNFTLNAGITSEVTFTGAIRNNSRSVVGEDGYRVQVINTTTNAVIVDEVIFPNTLTLFGYSIPVTFPTAGNYRLQFTEIDGQNNSYGALLDDVVLNVCFVSGTLIETDMGDIAVEALKSGDKVLTPNGYRTIQWIGRRRITKSDLKTHPNLRPICIAQNALGPNLPNRDLVISRQHRIMISSNTLRNRYKTDYALIAAHRFTVIPGISVATSIEEFDYFHILLDSHDVILSNNIPVESLLIGTETKKSLPCTVIDELQLIFPDLHSGGTMHPRHRIIKGRDADNIIKTHQRKSESVLCNWNTFKIRSRLDAFRYGPLKRSA